MQSEKGFLEVSKKFPQTIQEAISENLVWIHGAQHACKAVDGKD